MRLIRRDPNNGYIDSVLWIPKTQVNVEGVKSALTFTVNDKKELGGIRFLHLFRETPNHLLVPREFWEVSELAFPVIDNRPKSFPKVSVTSKITLDLKTPTESVQRDAVKAMQSARGGILQLACGKGKTVCALELIAREQVPAIIIVDNTHLVNQWLEAINMFLDVPGGIGMIGDGRFDWKKSVVIATYQTLSQKVLEFPQEARHWFGLTIWDEAHHMAAPTWAKTADLFYGKRIGLTATPERADGTHVIYDFHIGKVLYKDLIQELKPAIYFYWTGLDPDFNDPYIKAHTHSSTGELHTGMLAGYFGQWRERLDLILHEVKTAERQGRRVLVLSYSIAELINLFTLWCGSTELYTDIKYPTAQEVGETLEPAALTPQKMKSIFKRKAILQRGLSDPKVTDTYPLKMQLKEIDIHLRANDVAKKCAAEYARRQRDFLKKALSSNVSNTGIMIGDIPADKRMKTLREKQVVFSIMKYGREGLDEQSLDTVFVCEPMSQKNGLQQLMGRVLRKKAGKKTPVVVFFEDNVGPMIGMCTNLRRHLRSWPHDEGGPFEYHHVNHPTKEKDRKTWATL
jgi:superfamily II DNA or RNA helicase